MQLKVKCELLLAMPAALLLAGCPAPKEDAGEAAGGGNTASTASTQEGEMTTEQSAQQAAAEAGGDQSASAAAAGESVSQTDGAGGLQGQRALAALQSLNVDIDNGEVVIVPLAAGAQPLAVWTIKPASGPKAAPAESLKLQFSEQGGSLTLSDDYSGPLLSQRPQLKLTLSIPPDSAVSASLGNGALSIESNGKLKAKVGNGSLTLRGSCPGSQSEVGNGSIKAELTLLLGQHSFKVGNGGVKLKLGSGSSVSYSARTSIGNIDLGGLAGSVEKNMMSQSASGSLGGGAAKLEIEVGNGGIGLSS